LTLCRILLGSQLFLQVYYVRAGNELGHAAFQ